VIVTRVEITLLDSHGAILEEGEATSGEDD
jgi:hypothetical protein